MQHIMSHHSYFVLCLQHFIGMYLSKLDVPLRFTSG
ncbi:hypothetical protein Barb6_00958 [Bacteroidales bacterium Barb6]|nr:hypothetical protein Barb6_00958 [Bacteroidales bacterium Barb6]